ncbi:hypothetical protein [Glutamicibacter sp. TV12E]|uniref:hypothetical protein n=1 Tax=Glutamicibacter sp. TV12E TaxID=3446362 RepID=UPI00403442BA
MAIENSSPHGLVKYGAGTDPIPGRAGHNAMVDLLNALPGFRKGPVADRPAPASGIRFWFDDVTNRLYLNTGTEWTEYAPFGGATPKDVAVGGSNSEGTSVRSARADHVHKLVLATSAVPGALAAADKAKLDAIGLSAVLTGTATTAVPVASSSQGQWPNKATASLTFPVSAFPTIPTIIATVDGQSNPGWFSSVITETATRYAATLSVATSRTAALSLRWMAFV